MTTEVDQTPAVGPHVPNMSATTTSSTASTTVPKVSRFAANTGFVIPKNKLSGSLVPIFQGGKKPRGDATANNVDQIQTKTKWSPDLTQDAAVRRGRAIAYQTRVDQITQQLKLGNLDVGETEDSPVGAKNMVKNTYGRQLESEEVELLEIERREAIGEILKLNPSYKAPADFKPLLKEETVPIPVKEYPGCNFVALIFGPGSGTKKRLEKDTGATVQVYAIKANTGEKVEISTPHGIESLDAYDELFVRVSADSFEKVDGAVALIELLVSSISGNLGTGSMPAISGNDVNALSRTFDTAVSCATDSALNHRVPQLTPASPQGQFQYHNSWFPTSPMPPNLSAPILNSSIPTQSSPLNPSSLLGPRPAPAAGFNSIIQDSSLVSSSSQLPRQVLPQPYTPPMQPLGHTGPPQNFLVPNQNLPSAQPSNLSSLPLRGSHPQALGPLPGTRPLMPAGSSSGWSGTSAPLGLSNVAQLAPPAVFSQVPHPIVPRPVASDSSAIPNMLSTFSPGQFGPRLTCGPVNHPSLPFPPGPSLGSSPALSSGLRPTAVSVPRSVTPPMQSSLPVISMAPTLNPSPKPAMLPRPINSQAPPMLLSPSMPRGPSGSIPGNMPNFSPINQPAPIPARSQHSSSGDFTFQPHQTQGPTYPMVPRPGNQAANLHALAPQPAVQQQAPPFQFGVPNSTPQPPVMQVFPRPQSGNLMGMPQNQQHAMSAPPRPPAFPGTNAAPVPHMGLRNFVPPTRTPNMAGPFPPRPGHSLQHQQHYPVLPPRPGNFAPPNPRFSGDGFLQPTRPTSGHYPGQQVYDPFSPTSVPGASQRQGGGKANARKQENDPEYEDLMASVGVK
ncbi:splicing factor 1-like isoform X1 [Hibiscus syriacus]|uniref:splicing factor 1-like isoform X1 n=1 Tax=Hibiscus syriacus TaxID=106335 RepID=UPI001920D70B|nr:splicing factor 1-like isoform X1 [Hibiscus syriacus]XP_039064114.1 splicing factor 1-like isoform X1 [Hibiscus syriacus]XP_039064115.1 splicing factor 1-like isoform X1 [Hibiscus syriacus]